MDGLTNKKRIYVEFMRLAMVYSVSQLLYVERESLAYAQQRYAALCANPK
jgi:hypothetical protein